MSFRILLLKLCFLLSLSINAQQTSIEDLKSQIESASGTQKVDLLNQLAEALAATKTKEALDYAEESYKISKKSNYSQGVFSSAMLVGKLEYNNNKFKKAARYVEDAVLAAKRLRRDESQLEALGLLIKIYQKDDRPKKLQDTGLEYRKLRNALDLKTKTAELEALQEDYAATEDSLNRVESENDIISTQNEEILQTLGATIEEKKVQQENIERLTEEKAVLEFRTLQLENETMKNALEASERERQILEAEAQLKRQQFWLSTLVVAFVGALSFIFLLSRFYRLKRAREEERTSLQKQLMLKEKMASLGELTAGIAHEIKNPLNFVNNFAEGTTYLIEEMEDALVDNQKILATDQYEIFEELVGEVKKNSEDILEHGKRADRIVNSMMEHARGEKGIPQLSSVNNVIEDNINLAYNGFRAKHPLFTAEIKKELDPNLPDTMLIPQEIGRVFLNLFNNACDALEEKKNKLGTSFIPQIKVVTKKAGENIVIVVRDNGPGISEEDRKKIFNPFFTTKPTGQGNTGLGLSISYDIIVQGHEGELKVESEKNEYTKFLIRLPIKTQVAL